MVEELYRAFEYEQALAEIERARTYPENTTEDRVWLGLMEGVLAIEVGDARRGRAAFERALELAPDAVLPVLAAPRIRDIFEAARTEVQRRAAAQSPSSPRSGAASAEAPPMGKPSRPSPAPPPAPTGSPEDPAAREAATAVTPPPFTSTPTDQGIRGVASVRVLFDPIGGAAGGVLDAGAAWGAVELRARWAPGTRHALGLDATAMWRAGRVGLHAGVRGMTVPAAGAWGGGPIAGARVWFGRSVYAVTDASAEWYSAPPRFRRFALVLTAGVGVSLGTKPSLER